MIKAFIKYIFVICVVAVFFTSCSKSDGGTASPPASTQPPFTPTSSNCLLSGISQVNSGTKPEFSLSVAFDGSFNVKNIITYDSTVSERTFNADFSYVTVDSIIIDPYQYIKLDASKRVSIFSTRSDLVNPATADKYKFQYSYDTQGYLVKKDMYVNGSTLPNFSTSYTYSNNLLLKCLMTTVSAGNLKVLEADLTYDNTIDIKNWIYTFPDATIDNIHSIAFNFGIRATHPLKKVVTKIYNPVTGTMLDNWTTNYGSYKVNSNGNVTYGIATGDLQQGIAVFYGKTFFSYNCR